MKRFILKISIFFLILLACDFVVGYAMNCIVKEIKTGGQARDNYICNEADEDILVFGSSRAVHHYNSEIIEDSLKLSCYNCGEDGQGIILSYARLKMISERHKPMVVIHDVSDFMDFYKNDNHTYLKWLKYRYDRDGISELFDLVDDKEKYKMYSQMYRYNSKFLQNIFVYVSSRSSDMGIKGYRPSYGTFDIMKTKKIEQEESDYEMDSVKMKFVDKFADLSKGAKLYFVISPIWYGKEQKDVNFIKSLCASKGIKFVDFSNNPKYVHNNMYFKDGTHLNSMGADEFTKDLMKIIKSDSIK